MRPSRRFSELEIVGTDLEARRVDQARKECVFRITAVCIFLLTWRQLVLRVFQSEARCHGHQAPWLQCARHLFHRLGVISKMLD